MWTLLLYILLLQVKKQRRMLPGVKRVFVRITSLEIISVNVLCPPHCTNLHFSFCHFEWKFVIKCVNYDVKKLNSYLILPVVNLNDCDFMKHSLNLLPCDDSWLTRLYSTIWWGLLGSGSLPPERRHLLSPVLHVDRAALQHAYATGAVGIAKLSLTSLPPSNTSCSCLDFSVMLQEKEMQSHIEKQSPPSMQLPHDAYCMLGADPSVCVTVICVNVEKNMTVGKIVRWVTKHVSVY